MSGDRSVPDDHRDERTASVGVCPACRLQRGDDIACGSCHHWSSREWEEFVPSSWRVRAVAAEERAARLEEANLELRGLTSRDPRPDSTLLFRLGDAAQKRREERDTAEERAATLAEALVTAAIPLEVIHGQEYVEPYTELSPGLKQEIAAAIFAIRSVLDSTTQKTEDTNG